MLSSVLLIFAVAIGLCLGFLGARLWVWLAAGLAWLWLAWLITAWPPVGLWVGLLLLGIAALGLAPTVLRKQYISAPLLALMRRNLPPMSNTEKEAIEAGNVWWDAELFSGRPDWRRLLAVPRPRLRPAEQAFLDGPVEDLCAALDDWTITHELEELPNRVWALMKQHRLFGMIIPQAYGGLGFSALAHSAVIMKLSSRSLSAAVTAMVPNSLGPAELLLHYGTEEQKDYYLPRLARGDEIPCFALTGPEAGSDAGAMEDTGLVCKGEFEGRKDVLGIRLNWEKRYITLGPVATLLGLAFKLQDPEHLLGDCNEPGITLALIPTATPGVTIGTRHRPMDLAFHNGPNRGDDVFIPVDWIIGGPEMAGKGWMMLMESLAAGRSISLPALSTGASKLTSFVTGAYAAIRRQFNTSVGQFEGVQEALARIAGNTYLMEAARSLTCSALDQGEKPSVISAIVKYHLTERMRQVINDGMDVHGGRGICMGPRNYLAPCYQGVPIAITVEGANILTRSLIIFGQGAIRCHPFILREMRASWDPDSRRGLDEFDHCLFAHLGHTLRNACRCLVLGLSGARLARSPASQHPLRYYYQQIARMSAALGLCSDVAMALFGGRLKRLERISARLGDVLSYLYLASAALKKFEDDARPFADRPLLHWSLRESLNEIQLALDDLFRNLPIPGAGRLLSLVVFPLGHPYGAPNDANDRRIARLLLRPSKARDRLTRGIFVGRPDEPIGRVEDALHKTIAAQGATQKLKHALRSGRISAATHEQTIRQATRLGILSQDQAATLQAADAARDEAIRVDDFPPQSFRRKQ